MNNQAILNNEMIQSTDSEMDGKYLTFWTEGQLFAIPISDVVQIIGIQEITPIPEFPSYAKGIIHLRGSVIPIIDVRLRFGKAETPYNDHTCIIVTNIYNRYVGFVVDSVNEVTNIDDQEISAPPSISEDQVNAYLTGIAKHNQKIILLLNTSKIIRDDHIDAFC